MFGGGGGGLFGDLPPSATEAAAAASSGGNGAETSENDRKRRRTQPEGDNASGDGRDRARDDGGVIGGTSVSSGIAPATKAAAAAPSLVDAIGKAGTAMAFVPAALARPRGVGTTARKSGGGGGGAGTGTATSRQQKHRQEEVRVEPAEKLRQREVQAKEPPSATRTAVDEDEGRQEEATTADPSKAGGGTLSGVGGENDGGAGEGGESEEMRTLHASVTDPYDPLVPNDYLSVREERRAAAKRKELEKEALETIRAQQEMRERIAEERRRIEATGDVRLIAASRGEGGTGLGAGAGAVGAAEKGDGAAVAAAPPAMGRGRGRGRGRGLSNLPAWLIQKQQEQEAAAATAGQFDDAGAAARERGRDENGDRRLVALRNMVAPGETDDELAQEVREECEESCGPVSSVTVKDADETCAEVRVLVLFKHADDARRASTLFHGRQFAGRRVSAELVGGGGEIGG